MKIESLTQKQDGSYVMGVSTTFQELSELITIGFNVCFNTGSDDDEDDDSDDGFEHEMPEEMQ